MDCQRCREALSARLDGEQEPVAAARTDEHLAGCAACRDWLCDATALHRRVRVLPLPAAPDEAVPGGVAASVLERLPRARRRLRWPLALGLVGFAQLVLGFAQVFGWDPGMHAPRPTAGDMSAHLFHESTAWNLALGVGMLWVAWRGRAATGLIPVFGGFLVVLTGFCVHDLAVGDATVPRVASHGLLVVGFVLMVLVWRRGRGRPAPRSAGRGRVDAVAATGQRRPSGPHGRVGPGGDGPYLRPVNRRRAGYRRAA